MSRYEATWSKKYKQNVVGSLPTSGWERLLRGWDADWVWRDGLSGDEANSWQRPQCVSLQSCENHGASGKEASRSFSWLTLCFLGPALSWAPLATPTAHCFLCPPPPINVRVLTGLPFGPLLVSFTFPFTHLLTPHWWRNESSISLVHIRINCGLVRMQILQVCVNTWYLFWGRTV